MSNDVGWKAPSKEAIEEWRARRIDATRFYKVRGSDAKERHLNTANVLFEQLKEAETTKEEVISYYVAETLSGGSSIVSIHAFEKYMAYLLMMQEMANGQQRGLL